MLPPVLSVGGMHEFIWAKREAGLSGWRRVGVDEFCVCRKVVTSHIYVSFVADFTPHIQQVFVTLHTLCM